MAGSARRLVAWQLAAGAAFAAALFAIAPAHADLQLCNRTSYVLELALGLESKGAVATRGWFRVDPGQCRAVLQGAVDAEQLYAHTRALPQYGNAPLPMTGHADLCVADGNFVIAGARKCPSGQQLGRFTAIKPSEDGGNLIANIAEEADYTNEQARLAGVQRLLVAAGYDANPIDGLEGKKTEAALTSFLKDRKLATDASNAAAFFDTLLDAAKKSDTFGLTWCNDTQNVVMAALGTEERGGIVTQGWYRVLPGRCYKPDVSGQPRRLYSFAEAVDADGQSIKRGQKTLAWGGPAVLCTRDVKFAIEDHKDCVDRGLAASGFAVIDPGRGNTTVRFRE
jgi:uncharacterized membrane protein